MRQVEATTTQQARRGLVAAVSAPALARTPWLTTAVPGSATYRTAMHAKGICRPPEAPT